jgi:hypothetical protein
MCFETTCFLVISNIRACHGHCDSCFNEMGREMHGDDCTPGRQANTTVCIAGNRRRRLFALRRSCLVLYAERSAVACTP